MWNKKKCFYEKPRTKAVYHICNILNMFYLLKFKVQLKYQISSFDFEIPEIFFFSKFSLVETTHWFCLYTRLFRAASR